MFTIWEYFRRVEVIHNQGDDNDPSDYSPQSDPDESNSELEPVRVALEFRSNSEESSTVPAKLHGLLFQLSITKAQEYKVKCIPRPGCVEFTYTMEFFDV
jgi:hypothetical protein